MAIATRQAKAGRRKKRKGIKQPSLYESMLVIPGIFVAAWQLGKGAVDVIDKAGGATAKAIGLGKPKKKKPRPKARPRNSKPAAKPAPKQQGVFLPSANDNSKQGAGTTNIYTSGVLDYMHSQQLNGKSTWSDRAKESGGR